MQNVHNQNVPKIYKLSIKLSARPALTLNQRLAEQDTEN